MTKAARNPNAWKLREIESDPQGYTAAQRAHREDQAREGQQRAEQKDRERFTKAFVANGGSQADAAAAYRERVNAQAAQAAAFADEAARRGQRGATMGKV